MSTTQPLHSIKLSTGAQIRAGRALLGWRVADLASAAGLHRNAVSYWERRAKLPRSEAVGCKCIRNALFAAGVVAVNMPAPGVCLLPEIATPSPPETVVATTGNSDAGTGAAFRANRDSHETLPASLYS